MSNTDDMAHNLVIIKPGARQEVVDAALKLGERGPAVNYIPASAAILWTIPVVVPEGMDSLSFIAPRESGVYPYVCTFPGHGFVMYGAMYVTEGKMPALQQDMAIPPTRRTGSVPASAHAGHETTEVERFHPYRPVAPYLYRIFMPDASPAAIAVCLPHDLAYCWDAGTCRLRYAWQGGFLDQKTLWPGKGDTQAQLVGTVFYRDKSRYPLQLSPTETSPAVDFKGYRLIDRYPEFRYTVDGLAVAESIRPQPGGNGLLRRFKIVGATRSVRFVTDPDDGVVYRASAGKWENNVLVLTPREAREFTLTMTQKNN
ncbi:hypothetical protein GCM10028773_08890 [Spirosoma koreense]